MDYIKSCRARPCALPRALLSIFMFVYKCDSCKKELDQDAKEKAVSIGSGKWGLLKDLLLCEKCGSSILKILKTKKFIK